MINLNAAGYSTPNHGSCQVQNLVVIAAGCHVDFCGQVWVPEHTVNDGQYVIFAFPVNGLLIVGAAAVACDRAVYESNNIVIPGGVNGASMTGGRIVTDLHIGQGQGTPDVYKNSAAVAPGRIIGYN